MKTKYILPILSIAFLMACVPSKKFEDVKNKSELCEEQRAALKKSNREMEESMTEAQESLADLQKRQKALKADTTVQGRSLRVMTSNYDKLNDTYELLLKKNRELLDGSQNETSKLFDNLQQSQSDLQAQSDALAATKRSLSDKEDELNKMSSELKTRAAKVDELESILHRKDSTVNALKSKVQDALLGFENNGLTIQRKNGKVYVSLDESLLFASGSYKVDAGGKKVLKKLAKVLEKNSDVNVMVEGHTDNVPYNGSGVIKDNWDLSVLRATAVVKIILDKSSIEQNRLTAAGKGEYLPIATNDTAEGRKKNRRTEIILTPKLDELFEILESN